MAVEWRHQLSPEEHLDWESLARPRHMTGNALVLNTALKPNPGIYLPLIGGSMKGDIDMAGHAFNGFYASPQQTCARIYLSTDQSIPHDTWTKVLLDSVQFDTQGEADLANNRIVCKTTNRRFILGHVAFCMVDVVPQQRYGVGIQVNGDWVSSSFNHSSIVNTITLDCLSPSFSTSADVIDLWIHHTSGVAVRILGGIWSTWLALY